MIERPKIAVITFLGSLDDHDAAWSLAAVDAEPQLQNPVIQTRCFDQQSGHKLRPS